jgi:hypothetical protein
MWANILKKLGVKLRAAPNGIDSGARKHPCPPEKRVAIIPEIYMPGRVQAGLSEGGL